VIPMGGAVVYLDDLQETDSKVGFGALGKHGDAGYHNHRTALQGKSYSHALSMVPPGFGASQVTYDVQGKYRAFRGIAALIDNAQATHSRSPVIFKVIGDDRVLWHSPPLQKCGTGQECAVNIDGVKTLRVEVHCAGGDHTDARAAWLDPA